MIKNAMHHLSQFKMYIGKGAERLKTIAGALRHIVWQLTDQTDQKKKKNQKGIRGFENRSDTLELIALCRIKHKAMRDDIIFKHM